ncbi:MAG: hypothetical protein MUF14_02420 [Hyphomonadaceae bacterium]|jgi:uncharacterized protein (DUF4415 family)|nr:hypothetical protein [Hyphomonadaceae bacterium]
MSLAEARALRDAGKTLTRPDAPEGPDLGDDFWANAVLVEPKARKSVHLRLDPGVYDFFVAETGGKGHIARMQAVLKAYADAKANGA